MPRTTAARRLPAYSVSCTDSFDRTNNPTSLGSNSAGVAWQSLVGTWGISSNRAVNTDSGINIALIETNVSNYTSLSVTINMPLGQRAGIVFRATDANNYLEFDVNQGSTANSIIKCVAGSRVSLTSINTGVGINDNVMQVILTGKRIQCYYSGTLRLDYTLSDADYALFGQDKTLAGIINIANTTCNFNDFSAVYTTTSRSTAPFRQIIPNTPTCLAFNGSSQAVTWASGLYNYTDKITLMGCFLFVDTTNFSNYPTFWSIGDNGGAFLIMNAPGTIGMHVKITTEKGTNTVGALSETGKFKFNQFYWIAGSYDSTVGSNNLNIYIFDLLGNLIETATSTQSGTITYTSTSPVLAWSYVRGYYMKMRASRLLVANAAFTQAEMQTFIRTEALSTANAAVTTYWPLADGSGSTAVPKIGTGNGTLTGSPTWTSAVPIPNRTVVT